MSKVMQNYYMMASAKGAIKLEAKGLGHSSGRSARKHWAKNLGLKPMTPADQVIAELQRRMDACIAYQTAPTHENVALMAGFALAKGSDGTFKYACMVNGSMQVSEDTYFTEAEMWADCCEQQNLIESSSINLTPESGENNG